MDSLGSEMHFLHWVFSSFFRLSVGTVFLMVVFFFRYWILGSRIVERVNDCEAGFSA